MLKLGLIFSLVFLQGCAAQSKPVPLPVAPVIAPVKKEPAAEAELKDQLKVLTARADSDEAKLRELADTNEYYRTQMEFYRSEAGALINILTSMKDCVKKDGIIGFLDGTGQPVCRPRINPQEKKP